MPDAPPLRITVAYAGGGVEAIVAVELPPGSTLADALTASRLLERPEIGGRAVDCAIHGERADPATPLRDGDRVELVRPLVADPKDARRRRAQENPLPRPRPRPKRGRRGRSSDIV